MLHILTIFPFLSTLHRIKLFEEGHKMRSIAFYFLIAILIYPQARATTLGVKGKSFTIDGKPSFLLGISYYAGLGAPCQFIRQDLEDMWT